jgi:hypothetical protein
LPLFDPPPTLQGLYERYTGALSDALHSFSAARADPEWAELATCEIVEIYLAPPDDPSDDDLRPEVLDNIAAAERYRKVC